MAGVVSVGAVVVPAFAVILIVALLLVGVRVRMRQVARANAEAAPAVGEQRMSRSDRALLRKILASEDEVVSVGAAHRGGLPRAA